MNISTPEWIWVDKDGSIDQYVEMRKEFQVDNLNAKAKLKVSVDSNFSAYVNGEFAGTGQFSDFPDNKTWTGFDITEKLVVGKNVLTILVHYCGIDTHSYIPGKAGLWFHLTAGSTEIVSDGDCMMRISPAYHQGKQTKVSCQMGFVFEYDARQDDAWRSTNYLAGSEWINAVVVREQKQPSERPLKQCELKARIPLELCAQGMLKRDFDSENDTVGKLMQKDFLSTRRVYEIFEGTNPVVCNVSALKGNDGFYIIADLGREECGFIDIEIEAGAGTIVDISTGEHLADLRVRSAVDNKINYASRYIAKEGRQSFTHYINRYSGRFVQVHFTEISANVKIYNAGIIPYEYPLNMIGNFKCPDSIFVRSYEVARRTLHLCIHEHYEDTPWREQALYANDSRNQALTGYYTFGEYDVPRVSFDMLGKTFRDDGFQELCAPMLFDFTIPSFTIVWFLAVRDHLMFSGDVDAARKQLPAIHRAMTTYIDMLENNLLPCPQGNSFWQFYDWADGLNGCDTPPWKKEGLNGKRFDAPLNIYFILALRAADEIFNACGEMAIAEQYRKQAILTHKAVNENFWVESQNLYQTYCGDYAITSHYAELTQALAILSEVADESKTIILQDRLKQEDNGLVGTTLSQSLYKFEAILYKRDDWANDVFSRIREDWGYMLYNGATNFWETLQGQSDFLYAGSLCHGWSAIPAYMFQRYLLGVAPLTPGFKKFKVDPILSVVDSAAGSIPTPYGNIDVSWSKYGNDYQGKIRFPETLTLEVSSAKVKQINWKIEKYLK